MKNERNKKVIRKLLCVALAAVTLGTYVGTTLPQYTGTGIVAQAANSERDFYTEENDDGTICIRGYKGTSSDVVIPSYIFGEKVTVIHSMGGGAKYITSVTIPKSVTEIDEYAFSGCKELKSVTIPNSVTNIYPYTFRNCTGLTSIKIPDSVKSISNDAFYGCTGLKSVTIPNRVKTINNNTFYGCTGLKSVTIPNSVTYINGAFYGCTGLTSITIPNSVTCIGSGTFENCTGLTSITIPNSVTRIGGGYYNSGAFEGCTGLKSVTISNNVTEIESGTFKNCTELTSIVIPESVTHIYFGAFEGCENFTIYGQKNSYADKYANNNDIPFKAIDISVTEIKLSQTSITLEKGKTQTITATISPSNATNKTVTWTTSNSSVATVSKGKITAKGAGTATITAKTANGKTATCEVTVKNPTVDPTSINLSQTSITLEKGKTQTITATVSPSNATDKTVMWTTSNSSVATVSNGNITAKGAGTATITAKTVNGKTATCEVTVKNPTVDPTSINLSQTSITLEKGKTQTITATVSPSDATDKTVTWTTSNSSVATVSNGKITAKGAGTATITAKTVNGKTATCKVTVKNPTINVTDIKLNTTRTWLGRGESYQLNATVSPSNATNKKITWTSSNNNIATVSNGKVTAKKDGTVTITAKTSNGKTATCKITVQPPASKISLNKSTLYLGVGEKFQLTSSVQSGTASAKRGFSSSNNNICYTSGKGLLTAKKAGTVYVTVKTFNGKTAQCKVVVQPPAKAVHISKSWLTLHVGQKFQLSSWVDAGTASTKRAWSSSDNSTVYTSGNGLLTAKKEGTAYITVKTFNGVSSTLKVKVIK